MLIANYAAISSGLLSGSLHAITGPDHFMAILPLILHLRWWKSGLYGGCWGLGHGACSFILGLTAFLMKETFLKFSILESLVYYRFLSDLMIGTTLLVIGMMGLLEALEEDPEPVETTLSVEVSDLLETGRISEETIAFGCEIAITGKEGQNTTSIPSPSSVSTKTSVIRESLLIGTILINGFVLGLSWDGLPSLTPTMVLTSSQVLCFLFAYLVSTVCIMTLASALIGETTTWLSNQIHIDSDEKTQEQFSRRFTLMTSFVAFSIGLLWLTLGLMKAFLLFSLLSNDKSLDVQNDGIIMRSSVDLHNNNDGIMMTSFSQNPFIEKVVEETRNNDGVALSSPLTLTHYDFYLNLFVSSFSIIAMTLSIIVGILYPNNCMEQQMIRIASTLQSLFLHWSNRFTFWKGKISYLSRPLCLPCRFLFHQKTND